jgi:uncharacterized protein
LGPVPGVVPRVLPFAAFIALLAATPLLEASVDARWLVVGRGLVAAALLAFFWRAYVELRSPSRATVGDWLWAIGAGLGVAAAWVMLDAGWMRLGGEGQSGFVPVRADGSLDPTLVALRLFGFVLVVPVMEELFWRSFLMRWIERRDFLSVDPRTVGAMALGLSSLAFALEHREWLAGGLAGIAFGVIYRRTGNLRAVIASHGTTNLTIAGWILATRDWSLW